MKKKFVTIALLFAIGIVLSAMSALAVPVTIDQVEIEGKALSAVPSTNKLSFERGQDLDVRVELTATGDAKDVEVAAYITGYEYNNRGERLYDSAGPFDVTNDTSYVKRFTLSLPVRVDNDVYRLRVVVSDRDSSEFQKEYLLQVDALRHSVEIRDVAFNPANAVVAGRTLSSTVRVRNLGDQDEEDLKVTMSVPGLGLSVSDFINELDAGDSKNTEALFVTVPTCAEPGAYDVVTKVQFNEGFDSVTQKDTINVVRSSSCPLAQADEGQTTISIGSTIESVAAGENAVFALTVTNSGTKQKSFVFVPQGVTFGTVEMDPSNVVMVEAGESKTVLATLSVDSGASEGQKLFTIAVQDASGNTLKQITLRADVAGGSADVRFRNVLEIGLVVLIVLLIVVGLVIAFNRMRGPEEGEGKEQSYY